MSMFLIMAVIRITGGISTGKSSFCQSLREIVPAAKFFDADQEAHRLVDLNRSSFSKVSAIVLTRSIITSFF